MGLNGGVTDHLAHVHDATQTLVQTVDGLTDSQWSEPSLLPGWTRAHVVAHLALNAEALAAAVDSLRTDRVLPMYPSNEIRDADIAELGGGRIEPLRERFFASCSVWQEAMEEVDPDRLGTLVDRVPGGPSFPASEVVDMRWREVEIHHADLGAGYTQADWTAAFADYLLAVAAWDRGADHDLLLRTPVGDAAVGAGTGPVINGSVADLAWWLVGRGAAGGLSGDLPTLGPWTRRTTAR